MSQSPYPPAGQSQPSDQGQFMPNGRPRPGADAGGGLPQPRYVDYGNPRAYDTSVRPASGLTAARFAPAQIQRPTTAQPESAWSTQTRRVQEVAQHSKQVPVVSIAVWITAFLLGIGLLVVLGWFFLQFVIFSSANPVWWPINAFLAFTSLVVIILVMVLADRWDPQPIPLLIVAVLWGAAFAAGVSYVVNTLNTLLVYTVTGDGAIANWVGAVISAPTVEEITKGLGLIVLMLLARRYFNGPLDGVIYGALIGGGFAFTENILYYSRQVEDFGAGGVVLLFVIRGVLNIFGHAIYTALTGVVMGFVARKWGTISGGLVFIVAVIPGMLLHAIWNFFAGFPSGWVMITMLVCQFLLSVVWLISIAVLVWDESRLTRVRLGDYANQGWLTHEEVDMLATWKGRREGKQWAHALGAKPQMKKFIKEAADLASVRQRLLADGANPKVVAMESDLLQRLSANRQAMLQHTS
jgi:RsiW-degrading membrane proteinase PrsW (M82 family)